VAERARQLYVNNGVAKISGASLRVISCHLGGSSSVTGILNGASIGTSMGMSPQSGLPQNNRVGDLDAEALPYAVKTFSISVEEAQKQLSKQGGLQGISGVSNDVRDITDAASKGNANAALALDVFVASARHWIGSYFLQLNGADAIVFTAGIGENRAEMRAAICSNLDNLDIKIDAEKNNSTRATEAIISAADSAVKIFVIPTNEELVVAREAKRFLETKKN
jgi:acetate kinase